MAVIPGLISNLEMSWLLKPKFFPSRGEALSENRDICIGTKSRNVGDALVLTPLAEGLKIKYPHFKIYVFARAFNPVAFYGNPYVERVQYLPKRVFGDDCSWGEGHLIQQKQRFFDLQLLEGVQVRPQLFIQRKETIWARHYLEGQFGNLGARPLCILHPSGLTWRNILPLSFWEKIISPFKESFHFLQLGLEGDQLIQGARPLFFRRNHFWDARKLFAVMPHANIFLGIDSGPMHVARAFSIPSCIFIIGEDPETLFKNLNQYPYYLKNNRKFCTLYHENTHLRVDSTTTSFLEKATQHFIHRGVI